MKDLIKNKILETLNLLILPVCPDASFEVSSEGKQFRINIVTGSPNLLLEDEFLSASQHLLRLCVHVFDNENRDKFLLDVNNTRQNKEIALKSKIPEIVYQRVLLGCKTVILCGLNSYERLIVHKLLLDVKNITTKSVGLEPNRNLLISPENSQGTNNSVIIDIEDLLLN